MDQKPAKAFTDLSQIAFARAKSFYPEFEILQKTVDAVNSFNSLYKVGRAGKRGGHLPMLNKIYTGLCSFLPVPVWTF